MYCTVLYCTELYCTVLYFTVLYCTVRYCTVLYYTGLYCTVLYCTVLYCTIAMYSRYSFDEMEPGYPKEISKGFEGIPNNVDAAFVWSGNGKIYFFKVSIYLQSSSYISIQWRRLSISILISTNLSNSMRHINKEFFLILAKEINCTNNKNSSSLYWYNRQPL